MERLTLSVCPVCLKTIEAIQKESDGNIFLEKTCPEHGTYRTLIWEGQPNYWLWGVKKRPTRRPSEEGVKYGCPRDCGLCGHHRQRTCCVLLEVTHRCNLRCPVCFANAGIIETNPSIDTIESWYRILTEKAPGANIQLSGGEPTVRNDLPEIIQLGKKLGFRYFQLNTNGLRIADEDGYVKMLKESGLNCVFLQFDGFKESTQMALRGKSVLNKKLKAIENCRKAGVPVVLVPVLAEGINDDEIGDIIRFAIDNLPIVRGVHFQPLSHFGRCDIQNNRHITLPRLLRQIETQTEGKIKVHDFSGGTAENPLCSFSGNFVVTKEGEISSVGNGNGSCCCSHVVDEEPDLSQDTAVEHARNTVAKRWGAEIPAAEPDSIDPESLDGMLYLLKYRRFSISAMFFQDCMNLDLERLQDCYINIMSPDGKLMPFCSYNLTSLDGTALHRRS